MDYNLITKEWWSKRNFINVYTAANSTCTRKFKLYK